jgi:hypothetical protein
MVFGTLKKWAYRTFNQLILQNWGANIIKYFYYQLAFFTPGIFPANAISRKVTREIPN